MPDSEPRPHQDPARWDALIESVGPDSVLVVIRGWMGAALRAACSEEDVWQETLALAWRDREQHVWETVRKYRAWLLGIARNQVRGLARRLASAKRGGDHGVALFSEMGVGEGVPLSALLPAGSTTPSRIASASERARVLEEALDSLPADLAAVVRARLFEERPMEEIAAHLGIGLSAAWYRFKKGTEHYARALATLRSAATPPPGERPS